MAAQLGCLSVGGVFVAHPCSRGIAVYPPGACWILNTGVAVPARWDPSSKGLFQSPGLRQEAGDRTPASIRTLMPSSWVHSLSSPTVFWLLLSPIDLALATL